MRQEDMENWEVFESKYLYPA